MKSAFRNSLPLCAAVLLLAASARSQTLTVTNNLVVWLKPETLAQANGSAVNFWGDSSTNQNDAVSLSGPGAPTYVTNGINGRPSVQFDGTTDFLALTNKLDVNYGNTPRLRLSSAMTLIAVFRTTSTDGSWVYEGNAPQNLIGDHSNAIEHGFGLTNGLPQYNHYVGGWKHLTGNTSLNNTNTYPGHFMIAMHTSSGGLARLYADGIFQGSTNMAYNSFTGISRIGGGYLNGSGTGDLFDGLIGEVLVYDATLSAADLQTVSTYLTSRWLDIPEPSTAAFAGVALAIGLVRRSRIAWR